jgi:prepilin-type N-terminal cleavage/methylation domain-containing protein
MNNRATNDFRVPKGRLNPWFYLPGSSFNRSFRTQAVAQSAFTLIELLVVIAIIGILAALILPLSSVASAKMRTARVTTELNQYITAIESYKLETGSYPPDNGNLRTVQGNPTAYKTNAAISPLFYELTGAIFTNGTFRTMVGDEIVMPVTLQNAFNVSGIQNSARNKHDLSYKGFSVRSSQYAQLQTPSGPIDVLSVPVEGPNDLKGVKNKKINLWYYDASTTNRHNRSGFDLWAEIRVGKNTNIIGNWKN